MKIKTLRRVNYNPGVAKAYAKAMLDVIGEMTKSADYWVKAQWNAKLNGRSMDEIAENLDELKQGWLAKFDNLSLRVAPAFAKQIERGTTMALKKSLSAYDIPTVRFSMTKEMTEAVNGIVAENVNLIKSIPERYFTQVQTIALQSITRGRDLQYMTDELVKQTGITRRRAANIARDQNNKATAELSKVRQEALGITEGIWIHSGGGSEPRPKHVKANGRRFKLAEGLPVGEGGEYVLPGQEINCGCTWKPVLPY